MRAERVLEFRKGDACPPLTRGPHGNLRVDWIDRTRRGRATVVRQFLIRCETGISVGVSVGEGVEYEDREIVAWFPVVLDGTPLGGDFSQWEDAHVATCAIEALGCRLEWSAPLRMSEWMSKLFELGKKPSRFESPMDHDVYYQFLTPMGWQRGPLVEECEGHAEIKWPLDCLAVFAHHSSDGAFSCPYDETEWESDDKDALRAAQEAFGSQPKSWFSY